MENIMIDLETLGNGNKAAIVAIGAVAFDHTGLGSTFYVNVDPTDCQNWGMEIDASTVMWWMKQGVEAREALSAGTKVSLDDALGRLSEFVDSAAGSGATVWGNGATFDNVILDNAYKMLGRRKPWSYRGDRCFRTLRALYPHITQDNIGVAHNALDDAKYQALLASKILAFIREHSHA